jgi:PHD/YefM family antitoxin component YafN of YafNO toxin-antitoxin module
MIRANDLKTKGIKAIEAELSQKDEVILTHRGKPRYVVIDIEEYDRMRALEIEAAYHELIQKKKEGKAYASGAEELIERIENEL